MWPTKDIPQDYLDLAQALVKRESVTKQEFLRLCNLAVHYVDAGQTNSQSQADMFLYIANIWLKHDNVSDGSITDDIGGEFAEWEIPGQLQLQHDTDQKLWARLKSWLDIANEKYLNSSDGA
jgi:hypothetical protein